MHAFYLLAFVSLTACGRPDTSTSVDTSSVVLTDEDGDGFDSETDCDDSNADINPDAAETCNQVDDNCDGTVDEGVTLTFYADADIDGFGDATKPTQACAAPDGFVDDNTDCDDISDSIYPGAVEACNLLDDNCDGAVDEGVTLTFYADADVDGFGDATKPTPACAAPDGFVDDNTDCDDLSDSVYPGAVEIWYDGVDQDCQGGNDWDQDGDGFTAYSFSGTDCNDTDVTEHLCGSSATTALPTCQHILDIQPQATSGAYFINPGSGAAFEAFCDMETDGGGWTICGKFDRDNGVDRYLRSPFARDAINRSDLSDVLSFTSAQASQDCRQLIQQGASEILSAATDDGAQPWAFGRINNLLQEVQDDPTHLWDINLDENGGGAVASNMLLTYDLDHVDLGAVDEGSLAQRAMIVGNGAMWTNDGRLGANFSNAGYNSSVFPGNATARDTVYWGWYDLNGGTDDHGSGATVVGTGSARTLATYRYNLMFMR